MGGRESRGGFIMITGKIFHRGKKSVFFYAGALYRKVIKNSFFNKIFLVYLAITFVSCIILFFHADSEPYFRKI